MLEKSLKKDNFFKLINLNLFFLRTSASGETGSPRLFTYHEIWPSAIINDLTIYCLKKTASIATGSIVYRRYWLSARYVLYISTEITLGYSVSMHSLALTSPCWLAVRLEPLQD